MCLYRQQTSPWEAAFCLPEEVCTCSGLLERLEGRREKKMCLNLRRSTKKKSSFMSQKYHLCRNKTYYLSFCYSWRHTSWQGLEFLGIFCYIKKDGSWQPGLSSLLFSSFYPKKKIDVFSVVCSVTPQKTMSSVLHTSHSFSMIEIFVPLICHGIQVPFTIVTHWIFGRYIFFQKA